MKLEAGGGGPVTLTASDHAVVTLDAAAAVLLALSGQEIGLNVQVANLVFAGPASGPAAAPTFRALVAADVPDGADETAIHLWEGYTSFGSDSPVSGQTYAP